MTLEQALALFGAVVSGVSLTYPTNALGHVIGTVNGVLVSGHFVPTDAPNMKHLAACLIEHAKES